ncbi:Outer membrane receptor proteins, mostly Fe transport [Flavobacterium succinicans]|uniref:Outer membrane receptor proteins, mostly Fe transport n=1 Tax=Flavobacterium succinicans TaxID=29536 RepID=A0A1I4VQC8_9FLAO|nr:MULTISPECIES: TonB-dependent receptor [Flavobacterium]SFN03315.1 Outer membrane receptor proteins, mostly Fe transport [Flavobacterium succinicans]
MKLKLLILTLCISVFGFSQNKGTITGILSDKDSNNQPLPFANVTLKGTKIGVNTDIDGKYSISVSPGNYVVQFSFVGYETVEVPVNVKEGATVTLNKAIGSGSYKLEDVVIKATAPSREKETAILLDQKNAVVFKQSIGAQEMARKGVSDVEEGLTKITGITKVESRGLFVRGLEDRYNNLLINELQAPSNSPFTKIIPLDIFPTDIVGVLNVYKTFNPNISGDFAGATVNIETVQAKSITKLSVGVGYTTNNNAADFLIHSDANNTQGFFGLNGKDRQLSGVFGKVPSTKIMTPDEYNNAYENNTWNVDKTSSPLNTSVGFIHAEKFNLENGNKINYTLSLNGDNKYVIRKGVDRTFILGAGDYDNNLQKESYSYQTNASALAAINYKTNRFDIGLNSFYLRSTDSEIQDQLGYTNNQSSNPNILIRTNQFDQSDYINSQLFGNVKLTSDEKHTLKFGGSFVKTSYEQPDRKFIIGEKVSPTEINVSYGGNHLNRQYLDIKGNYYFSGLLEYNLKFNEKENGKSNRLTVGYNVFENDLKSTYRIFSGLRSVNKNYTAPINTINSFIVDDINNGILAVREESNADYKVKLNQIVNAGYINYLHNFGEKLEVNAGVRVENSDRIVSYRSIGQIINGPYKKIDDQNLDILPVLNAKYQVTETSNLRFNGSKTITRPVTMELLPIQYISPDGKSILGNPNLKNTENFNIDLKYELFPKNNELIAVGLFAKQIQNPIERIFIASAGGSGQQMNYKNSKEASLFGAEIELLLQLDRISPALADFSFGLNTSLSKTDVKVEYGATSIENNPSRKLQGASEWIINSDLKYDFEFSEVMKNSISLVYGVYGPRIFAVGSAGMDNIYEKPFHKLDFIWSSKLTKNIDAKFSVDNLLNPLYKMELGNNNKFAINEDSLLLESFKRGRGFSLNLSYTF